MEKPIESCVEAYAWCRKKCRFFLAADEWIKREWPNFIAEYSPEDIYNTDETGNVFRAMPEHTYLFKDEGAKGF
jgi:hypothetical protein